MQYFSYLCFYLWQVCLIVPKTIEIVRATLDKVKDTAIVYRGVPWSKINGAKIPGQIQMMIIILNKLNGHSMNYLEDGGSSPP